MFVLGTGRERARRQLVAADRPAAPPGTARRPRRVAQPGTRDGPHRAAACSRTAARTPSAPCSSSTSTTSRTSTTRSATAPVTGCWSRSRPRLSSTLRDADTIGRMGGDEFVVLLDGGTLDVAPELVAQRVLDVMRQPFELDGASIALKVNTSIGIAIGDRASAEDLLRDADVALYEAKAVRQEPLRELRPRRCRPTISRRTRAGVRSALGVPDTSSGWSTNRSTTSTDLTVVGVEALLRWDHPTLGRSVPTSSSRSSSRPARSARSAAGCCSGPASRWPPGTPRRHPRRLRQRLRPPARQRRHRRRRPRRTPTVASARRPSSSRSPRPR